MKDKTIRILIGAIALIVAANHWLYKSEVACEESGGTYVRAVWGYKCIGTKT
jgi:hypothetical protein